MVDLKVSLNYTLDTSNDDRLSFAIGDFVCVRMRRTILLCLTKLLYLSPFMGRLLNTADCLADRD